MPLLGISGSDVKIAGWNTLMSFAQFGACAATAWTINKIGQNFSKLYSQRILDDDYDFNHYTIGVLATALSFQESSKLISHYIKPSPIENITANRKLIFIQFLFSFAARFLLKKKTACEIAIACLGASYFDNRGVQMIQALGTIFGTRISLRVPLKKN